MGPPHKVYVPPHPSPLLLLCPPVLVPLHIIKAEGKPCVVPEFAVNGNQDFESFLYKDKWWWLIRFAKFSLFSTVISFVYKDKWWFDESMSVIFCMENIWKRILLFPLHIELNLTTLLCNWRGSPWRPGRTKSIIQKGIIPARTQSQDNKFQTSRPCEVRRSGQVTTFVVCAVLSLSFQAVVLLTKTAINHRFLSIKSEMSGWISEIPTILS